MTNGDPAETNGTASRRPRRLTAIAGSTLASLLAVGLVAFYVTGGFAGNAATACPEARAVANAIDPLIGGQVAAVQPLKTPVDVRQLAFLTPDGKPVHVADYRGKTVLLNLWATWCPPCRVEMPWLAKLQSTLGQRNDFQVVAVSVDMQDDGRAAKMLKDIGVTDLTAYKEPTMALFNALKTDGLAQGMPTTLLVDRTGCAAAVINGPADWSSPEAKRLIEAALKA